MGATASGGGRNAGWDFVRPADVASVGGVAMIGFRSCSGGGLDIRVAGIPAVTMVVEFGENELTVDSDAGQQSLAGFVSGFLQGTMRVHSKRVECIEVRLSPILTHSLLGVAPTDLSCPVVALEDLWGQRARWLREQLADAVTWEERFALTRSFLVQSHEPTRTPHPEVVASWERIVASRGQVQVGELAASCGWSRKRLWARFESQIGLTPKRAAMLVRFRHAVDGLLAGRPAADVAVACGYTDQSHLCRDVSIFADITPGALTGDALTAISKRRYQAWGTFFQDQARPIGR
jgi:AraC-like DNA-binding protein